MDPIQHKACCEALKHSRAFSAGVEKRNRILRSWDSMAQRYQRVFDVLQNELWIHKSFEAIYCRNEVLDIRSAGEDSQVLAHLPCLIIWMGAHPVWHSKTQMGSKFLVEGGCALSVTQQLDGSVVVSAIPYRNEAEPQAKEPLVLDFYSEPEKITETDALEHLSVFLSYAVHTSLYAHRTLSIRRTIAWARLRHWWLVKFHPAMIGEWLRAVAPSIIKAATALIKAAPAAA